MSGQSRPHVAAMCATEVGPAATTIRPRASRRRSSPVPGSTSARSAPELPVVAACATSSPAAVSRTGVTRPARAQYDRTWPVRSVTSTEVPPGPYEETSRSPPRQAGTTRTSSPSGTARPRAGSSSDRLRTVVGVPTVATRPPGTCCSRAPSYRSSRSPGTGLERPVCASTTCGNAPLTSSRSPAGPVVGVPVTRGSPSPKVSSGVGVARGTSIGYRWVPT